MGTKTKNILHQALELPPVEKAHFVDCLLASLDKPDQGIDHLWQETVDKRVEAYQEGKLASVSLQQALSKYQR